MPTKRISFSNFNRRLVVAGGREQTGPAALRRATGVAPETTNSVMSRWGSQLLYSAINAIQLYYWNGNRYAYDGSVLYQNGISIKTGFDGTRLTFNAMPPQIGLDDYLFILGGGQTPFKIDPSGNITNWGIVAPPNQMNITNAPQDQIVIDSFDSSASNWTHSNAAVSNNSTEFITGTGSLQVNPVAGQIPWRIVQTWASLQNWSGYTASGAISLETDVIQFWIFYGGDFNVTWLEIDIDVDDGTFRKNFYTFAIGFATPIATKQPAHIVNETLNFQPGQWQQITIAKSQFNRTGNELQFDWSSVKAWRFSGGGGQTFLLLDNLTLSGGCAMGAGPAVGNGGSEYDYYVVYRNTITGSQSNPQPDPAKVFNVQLNRTNLAQIPTSSDAQIGARDLYRSQALTNEPPGATAFYLDTIYDNTTTTYLDQTADESIPRATTPWQKSVAVPPNSAGFGYYIDGGNGYYFKLTTAGTTGSVPPTWIVPSTSWSANTQFYLNETVGPRKANGQFWKVTTAGKSGILEPNWAASPTLGATITDGTVVWTNQSLQTTTDGTVVWTFQGINSTPVLGNDELLFDNAPPLATYGDAWGPHAGSMFWCRDSAVGAQGNLYASPPGRPESVGQIYQITHTDDPTQKVVGWDSALWLFSTQRALQLVGNYPQIAPQDVNYALGTNVPYTIVPVQAVGIIYWAPDGVRVMNWSGSRLIGFEQLSPIFRGQQEESMLSPWSSISGPVFAALMRDEILFSDGAQMTLALSYDGIFGQPPLWRVPGLVITAAYYEAQTGEIQAAFGGNIYFYEKPTLLSDGGTAIPFEIQSPGDFPDSGAEFTTQRIYITMNATTDGGPVSLTPTLIVDGTSYTLPAISGTNRQTYELSPKVAGRFFDAIRLTGSLLGRVEVFRIEADVYLGEQDQPQ